MVEQRAGNEESDGTGQPPNEELAVMAQSGNRCAAAQLWERVKKLLYFKAHRFYIRQGADNCARHGVALEDLGQECYFAFLDAVRAYKPGGEYQFTTYLTYAAENRFRACMGVYGTKRNALDYADSMNQPAGEDEADTERGDLLPDVKATAELEAVDEREERSFFHNLLERSLKELPSVQESILRLRYFGKQTGLQTAEALHITRQDVRREEAKALRNMRGGECLRLLHPFHDDIMNARAYRGTGFGAWKQRGSSEEWLVEYIEEQERSGDGRF